MAGLGRRRGGRAAGLLAGGALSLLFASAASAQTMVELPVRVAGSPIPMLPSELPHREPPKPAPVNTDDGLGQKGFYLEADTLIRDEKADRWTARGGVEVRSQGRTLRADEVIYDAATGVVTANGHAQIIQSDGTVESGEHIVLDQKMRLGFARVFALHGPDNTTVAADVAIRRSETENDMTRAVFTPCAICAADGSSITPTWSIKASRMVEDRDRHIVYYRDAVIMIKDVPVFYTPVFWHPDPQSDRQSGLLIPQQVSTTGKLGISYAQPYLQVISPSQELEITPQINSAQNPFLTLGWLERFYSGQIDARFGYTYSQNFNGNGTRYGADTSRSFLLANGHFDVNSLWSWGFTLDRASDPLIFEKYDVPHVFSDQGLYQSDTQRLLSQLFATREDGDSYISIAALDFQGLRTNPQGITENSATFPVVAPLIEARYEPALDILGGRLRFVGSGVVETTPQSATDLSEQGLDDRRGTVEADWQSNYTLSDGIRLSPFVDLRGDLYNIQNLSPSDTADKTIGRSLGTIGLNLSWPFINQIGGASVILEPLAQLDISPNVSLNSKIPNTDSSVVVFDETNLFSMDRFTGFDVYAGGQRLNLGGRVTVDWGDNLSAIVLLGRSFQASPTNVYAPNTGLNKTASDWVLSADTTPVDGFSLFSRALLNDDLQSELTEVGVDFARWRVRGYVRYDDDNTQPTGRTRDVEASGEFFVTKHWGFSLVGIRDIEANQWRTRDLGVVYMDDCVRVEVVYQHQNTIVGSLGASDSVFVRLKLAILGDQGYRNADFR
jgi:LPS-assembly protein